MDEDSVGPSRTAGAFLVLGFLASLIGAFLFIGRRGSPGDGGQTLGFVLERSLIMSAVVFTVIGLVLLQGILRDAGDRVLARGGAIAFLIGAVLVLTAEALGLGHGELPFPLTAAYVILALLGLAAFGGALLRTSLLPNLIGWITVVWSFGWLIALPVVTPTDIYFPVLQHVMPLVIGTALLLRAESSPS